MIVRAQQGDTLDNLCHRHLGDSTDVEAALILNPGLAAGGPVIATGHPVTLPERIGTAPPVKPTIQLWD